MPVPRNNTANPNPLLVTLVSGCANRYHLEVIKDLHHQKRPLRRPIGN